MANRAHSTPVSDVHPLTGSSAPGSVFPNFSSVSEMPSTFVALGNGAADVVAALATRRAAPIHPDAELIDLAEWAKALCLRHQRVELRVLAIQERLDLWSFANRPVAPLRTGSSMVCERSKTDTHSIMVFKEPLEVDEQRKRDAAEHQSAVDAHEASMARRRARTRAPYLSKIALRMWCRYVRWTSRLSSLPASTSEGLAAKAAVYQIVTKFDAETEWGIELARAVADDAVRIAVGQAHGVASCDANLMALIAGHAPALAAAAVAEVALKEARSRFDAAEPAKPASIYWRAGDGIGATASGREPSQSAGWRMFYTDADIAALEAQPTPVSYVNRPRANPDDPIFQFVPDERRLARRAEILAAYDTWKADRRVVAESTGWRAANAEHARLSRKAREIEDSILEAPVHSLAGLQAKACWIEQQDKVEEWSEFVLYDAIGLDTPTVMSAEDATPSREVVESYRTFLDMELRFLNWETHRSPDAIGGIWLDCPAGHFHGGDEAPPSSRAATVLSLLGLMPEEMANDQPLAVRGAA